VILDISKSYLVPFDPDNTGEPFGFMRANINGRDQWWLVQVWAEDDADETVMVRFLEPDGPGNEFEDMAEGFKGRPWYPISWLSDDVPKRQAFSYRLQLDFPEGVRITHEWGPGAVDPAGKRTIVGMVEKAVGGLADA